MRALQLNAKQSKDISDLLQTLVTRYHTPCEESFLVRAKAYAGELPPDILIALNEFRYRDDHNGTFLLRGFEINNDRLEATPQTTGREMDEASAAREGFFLILLTSLLGEVFGWSTQRNGALINNIIPVKNHETEQLSTGSAVDLDWHTEEAFHPFRADFLSLLCLRNPDDIPTVIGSIQDVCLDRAVKKILFSPRFIFQVDKNFQNGLFDLTTPVPVLFGDFDDPYVRIDPSFMNALPGDIEAQDALDTITRSFQHVLTDVALQPGDILFLDNYRVVHGRKAFKPRFDGTDRWLKRVNITTDLRKSRAMRQSHASRIIITSKLETV